jgi:hypothetical protein
MPADSLSVHGAGAAEPWLEAIKAGMMQHAGQIASWDGAYGAVFLLRRWLPTAAFDAFVRTQFPFLIRNKAPAPAVRKEHARDPGATADPAPGPPADIQRQPRTALASAQARIRRRVPSGEPVSVSAALVLVTGSMSDRLGRKGMLPRGLRRRGPATRLGTAIRLG